eukprot:6085810-Alexandrium_andersonii.AAC.1
MLVSKQRDNNYTRTTTRIATILAITGDRHTNTDAHAHTNGATKQHFWVAQLMTTVQLLCRSDAAQGMGYGCVRIGVACPGMPHFPPASSFGGPDR